MSSQSSQPILAAQARSRTARTRPTEANRSTAGVGQPAGPRQKYRTSNLGRLGCINAARIGYICELLVAADMNARCGRAYMNPEPQTKHDVYARTSHDWKTVQVKKAQVNRRTGKWRISDSNRKTVSDILALVDLDELKVCYAAVRGELPSELPVTPSVLCSRLMLEEVLSA